MSTINFKSDPLDIEKELRQIMDDFLIEQTALDPFRQYLGDNGSMIFNKTFKITQGSGTQLVFSLTHTPQLNEVYDDESLEGRGTFEKPVNATLNVGEVRFASAARGFLLNEYQTELHVIRSLGQQQAQKLELFQKATNINQFAYCFSSGSRKDYHKIKNYYLKENQQISDFESYHIPKIKECTINQINAAGDGISSDRVLFGGEPLENVIPAGNSIVERCVVGDAGIDSANIGKVDPGAGTGRCTLKHLRKLIDMANFGGRKINMEMAITPMKYVNFLNHVGNGFVYFISTDVRNSLFLDDEFKELYKAQGSIREKIQPTYFNGTNYLGNIYGTDIVVCDELNYLSFNNAAGNARIGYGVLAGKNAFVKASAGEVMTKNTEKDYGKFYEIGTTFFTGMKPLKFPSKRYKNVLTYPHLEMGLIHSFTIVS